MGPVTIDLSMSLDGFITGPDPTPEQGLGIGGERIFAWMMDAPARDGTRILSDAYDEMIGTDIDSTGAVIMGKRMFEIIDGPEGWMAPNGYRFPWSVFVLTHEVRPTITKGITTFTFVNNGPEAALAGARAKAGEKRIAVNGGETSQQFLRAGLVDEMRIHLVPVFLGSGVRLFDRIGESPRAMTFTGGQQLGGVMHLAFRFA
ncbi:MAG: dihydrofolate reductase family protein [Thermomicrobiales bacterium]